MSHINVFTVDGSGRLPLVERYGQYTTDFDTDTSVKRIKTLRNNVVSNTAAWIINYGLFTIEWRVFTWKVRCPLSHVILTMWLPLNTEFYGGYSTKNGGNTTVYDTVSACVTNHPGGQNPITVSLELPLSFAIRFIGRSCGRGFERRWFILLERKRGKKCVSHSSFIYSVICICCI